MYGCSVRTTRIYGLYVRAVYTGVKNAPLYTARIYGSCVTAFSPTLIYGCQKRTRIYEPYIRPVYTARRYGSCVTALIILIKVDSDYPPVRAVYAGRTYGCDFYTRVCGPQLRPHMRVSIISMYCGPHVRVAPESRTSHYSVYFSVFLFFYLSIFLLIFTL